MKKIIGYIISIIGLAGLFSSFMPELKSAIFGKIAFMASLSDTILLVISLLLIVAGIFLIIKSPSKEKASEVPIYRGKDVVGFRRLGKQ